MSACDLTTVVAERSRANSNMVFDREWLQVIGPYAGLILADMVKFMINRNWANEVLINDSMSRKLPPVPANLAVPTYQKSGPIPAAILSNAHTAQ